MGTLARKSVLLSSKEGYGSASSVVRGSQKLIRGLKEQLDLSVNRAEAGQRDYRQPSVEVAQMDKRSIGCPRNPVTTSLVQDAHGSLSAR